MWTSYEVLVAGRPCTGLTAGRALWKYNIRHHSRNRTMYEWRGRSCLDSLPFRRRHPISLPEQNQTLFFFFPLAIEIEAGGCSRTCPIYLDDWLVSTLLTPICQTAAQCDQLCLPSLKMKILKILFDEMRFIDPFACWALFPSHACLC
jgi:hypothetical protein